MLSQLLGSVSLDLAAIPIWSQYVTGLEHVLDFLARTFNSAGIAIIVVTIIVKTLLLPLTIKAIRSSKSMQELQPKIKELQKKYGKDRQRISQETMALYQQYQINPLAGCLPMLIQIPIFFGVYRAIASLSSGSADGFSSVWAEGFLWLPSLNDSDPYKILPVMAGAFQFLQTRMARPAGMGKPTDPQQAMMNTMMNFMPLMVVVFGWTFAAGPVLYWVAQSVYSVVQQWLITGWGAMKDWFPRLPELPEHRQLGYRPPRDLDDVVVVTGADGKPVPQGRFMGWMQRKAEQAQDQRTKADEQRKQRTGAATNGGGAPAPKSSGAKGGKGKSGRPKIVATNGGNEAAEVEPPPPGMAPPKPVKQSSRAREQAAVVDDAAEIPAAPVAGTPPAPRKVKVSQRRPKS